MCPPRLQLHVSAARCTPNGGLGARETVHAASGANTRVWESFETSYQLTTFDEIHSCAHDIPSKTKGQTLASGLSLLSKQAPIRIPSRYSRDREWHFSRVSRRNFLPGSIDLDNESATRAAIVSRLTAVRCSVPLVCPDRKVHACTHV